MYKRENIPRCCPEMCHRAQSVISSHRLFSLTMQKLFLVDFGVPRMTGVVYSHVLSILLVVAAYIDATRVLRPNSFELQIVQSRNDFGCEPMLRTIITFPEKTVRDSECDITATVNSLSFVHHGVSFRDFFRVVQTQCASIRLRVLRWHLSAAFDAARKVNE